MKKNLKTREKISEITELYKSGYNQTDIAKIFSSNQTMIRKILKEEGIPSNPDYARQGRHRKYTLNEDAFNIITEESAYWIGMMTTDGHVSKQGYVQLTLQKADEEHINKFKSFMGSNAPLEPKEMVNREYKGRMIRGVGSVGVRLCSNKLIRSLKKYNIVPNKTFITSCPNILLSNKHFWRGCIDGDGCISKSTYKGNTVYRIGLYGTEMLCQQFTEFVKSLFPNENVHLCKSSHGNIFKVFLNNRRHCKMLLRYLYEDSAVYLQRKYETAMDFIENIKGYISYGVDVYDKEMNYIETISSFELCSKKFKLTKNSIVSAISKKQLVKREFYLKTNKSYTDETSVINRA